MQLTSEILLETAYLCVLWGALGAAVGLLCRQGIEAYTSHKRRRVPPRPVVAEAAPVLAAPPAPQLEITASVPQAQPLPHPVEALRPSEPRTSPAR